MSYPTFFKIFTTRSGYSYILLTIPSLILQSAYCYIILFFFTLGGSFSILLSVVLALSIFFGFGFSILTIRPTLSMLILGISFFVVTMIPSYPNPDPIVMLVALFMLMISFNFGRDAKISLDREKNVTSSGPTDLKLFSVALNILIPASSVFLLIFVASSLINLIQQQVSTLPYPISDLSFLYLQTRVGYIFLAILVSGIILWIIKEFLEPAILYYSIDRNMAKQMIKEEYDDSKKILEKKFLRFQLGKKLEYRKPNRPLIIIMLILFIAMITGLGWTSEDIMDNGANISDNLLGGVDGETLVGSFSDWAKIVDSYSFRLENLIRYISSLLWGG